MSEVDMSAEAILTPLSVSATLDLMGGANVVSAGGEISPLEMEISEVSPLDISE